MGQALGCALSAQVAGVFDEECEEDDGNPKENIRPEEKEHDSLALGTEIIPIAYTPQNATTTKDKIEGSFSKSMREVDLESERESYSSSKCYNMEV